MAAVFVASGGSNTSPYDTWAKAATSLQSALSLAGNGDVVVIQYNAVPSGDAELAADATYTVANTNVHVISASNDGGSAYTYTAMGTANWIGNSTTNRGISLSGGDTTSVWAGVTLRTSGSTSDSISCSGANQVTVWNECYFWSGNTNTGARINLSNAASAVSLFRNCTFRFGNASHGFNSTGTVRIIGGSISSSGSTPSILIKNTASGSVLEFFGVDLSLVTGTLVDDIPGGFRVAFAQCKLGSGVTALAAQSTNPTIASPEVFINDCHSGDTHMTMGYYNALGSVVSDSGIYFTSGAAGQSWKIVTTGNCAAAMVFRTPFVDMYHSASSAITPYMEIARDGSATAYQDHQVWAEFMAKVTSGTTLATRYSDKSAVVDGSSGSNQATGAGTGSWTGLSGTAWSGKCDSGSSLTPAEVGHIRALINVAVASSTVYVDPQIRT